MEFPKGSLNLYITEIGEPSENELRIVVAEGLLGESTAMEFAGHDLGEGRPIEITDASRHFEIGWGSYVPTRLEMKAIGRQRRVNRPYAITLTDGMAPPFNATSLRQPLLMTNTPALSSTGA